MTHRTSEGAADPARLPRGLEALLALHALALAVWLTLAAFPCDWYLEPGDHGRDLQCFARVAGGERPFADFQWIYGPLMPCLYGALFRAFGVSLAVARGAALVLVLLGAAIAFVVARRFRGALVAHAVAFLIVLWGPPQHTYNHLGLLVFFAAGLGALLSALGPARPGATALAATFLAGTLAGLVKWSAGLAWIAGCALLLLLRIELAGVEAAARRREAVRVAAAAAVATALLLLAALACFHGVPAHRRSLCLDVLAVHWNAAHSALDDFLVFFRRLGSVLAGEPGAWMDLFQPAVLLPVLLAGTFLGGAAWALVRARRPAPWDAEARRTLGLWVLSLLLAHEFLSIGSVYSLQYLSALPVLLLLAALLARARERLAARWTGAQARRLHTAAAIAWLAASTLWAAGWIGVLDKAPGVPLALAPGGGVRVLGHHRREEFEAVSAYVAAVTAPREAVAVLPYNGLIGFLADRPSPFYATMVLGGFSWEGPNEQELIDALEAGQVRCVVVTHWSMGWAPCLGFLGLSHLRALSAYVERWYQPVAYFGFGPWAPFRGAGDGQSAIVLWRRGAPPPREPGG